MLFPSFFLAPHLGVLVRLLDVLRDELDALERAGHLAERLARALAAGAAAVLKREGSELNELQNQSQVSNGIDI